MIDREQRSMRDMAHAHQDLEEGFVMVKNIILMRAKLSFSIFLGIDLIVYLSHSSVII